MRLMARVVHLRHGPDRRRHRLDGHDRQDRVHVRLVRPVGRKDEGRRGIGKAGPGEVVRVCRIAPDEVDAGSGRVLVGVGEDHDLLLVVVATELIDEVTGRAVPAAHDDVVPVAGRTQTLTLLQQEIDDHRDEGARDHPEHRDAEQDKQPADDTTPRRGHERRVALAEDRGDPPIERVEDRSEGPGLLEQRDQDRGDRDECDDALGQRQEEATVELAADASDVPRHAADEGRGQQRHGQATHRPRSCHTIGVRRQRSPRRRPVSVRARTTGRATRPPSGRPLRPSRSGRSTS